MESNIICCDWGTSSFRIRLVNGANYTVLAEQQTTEGVASTFKAWQAQPAADRFDFYADKLRSAMKTLAASSGMDLSRAPVIVSGMASSSIGMAEIDYAPLPFATDGSQASSRIYDNFNGPGNSLTVVSGIRSDDDVMRGEEAQLIGLFNLPETESIGSDQSVFVFPGTHSKHIWVRAKQITGFQTFMTGEIYNIVAENSILKDSIEREGALSVAENIGAFNAGVTASSSTNLLNTLFTVRTNQLFSKFSKAQNSFYLSGLLIGTELRGLFDASYKQLVICSGPHLFQHYKAAAETLNLIENTTFISPDLIDKATIAGQIQIFKALNN